MTMKREEFPSLPHGDQLVTRKEALMKAGRYAAFTAASMLLILDTVKGEGHPPSESPVPPGLRKPKKKKAKRTDPPPSY